MPADPVIGIAIPAYSRPELLERLIGTIPDPICAFVSDNAGSLQHSGLSLRERVVISPSSALIPMFANWNRALSLVSRDVTHVSIPSDDDLYLDGAFDHIRAAISAYKDVDIFVFGCDVVDEGGKASRGYRPPRLELLEPGQGFVRFRYGVEARMPGIVFRKAFLDRIGAFDERFALTASDSELIQRALLLGRSAFIPQVVGLYRVWAGNLTHSRQPTAQWMDEIDLWTDKISGLLEKGHQPSGMPLDIQVYKDEVYARNLLAGTRLLLDRKEYRAAHEFMRDRRRPRAASLRTRTKLLCCRTMLLRRHLS
jgi:hypothetical protein